MLELYHIKAVEAGRMDLDFILNFKVKNQKILSGKMMTVRTY